MKEISRNRESVGSYIVHTIKFDVPITKEEALHYAKDNGYFGFHPAGYGTGTIELIANGFTYTHYGSCD